MNLFERVFARCLEIGDCWEWQQATYQRSPVIRLNGKTVHVRRAIALEIHREIPAGMLATQNCGNLRCVNPAHITLFTRKQLQQRTTKLTQFHLNPARSKKLADVARSRGKLTPDVVFDIRNAEGTQRAIAARFGVSQGTVWSLRRGRTWRDYNSPFSTIVKALRK